MNITLENISFAYSKTPLFENISAQLAPGKVHFLAGPNGCGKSTLLKIMAGFLAPLSGTVKLDERPLDSYSDGERARIMGVMWQDLPTSLDFTVRETVEIFASARFKRLQKLSAEEQSSIDQALLDVGLFDLALRRINTLSGGERQRMMLAGVMALAPEVMLLDEPTCALDPAHRNMVFALLKEYAKKHTVLVITHDLELLARAEDQVWLLDSEKNFQSGRADMILTESVLSKVYNAPAKVIWQDTRRIYFD